MPDTSETDALLEEIAEGLWERLREIVRLRRKLEEFVF
jgi:hypothetical protein